MTGTIKKFQVTYIAKVRKKAWVDGVDLEDAQNNFDNGREYNDEELEELSMERVESLVEKT
jgi:hypothetical protein